MPDLGLQASECEDATLLSKMAIVNARVMSRADDESCDDADVPLASRQSLQSICSALERTMVASEADAEVVFVTCHMAKGMGFDRVVYGNFDIYIYLSLFLLGPALPLSRSPALPHLLAPHHPAHDVQCATFLVVARVQVLIGARAIRWCARSPVVQVRRRF